MKESPQSTTGESGKQVQELQLSYSQRLIIALLLPFVIAAIQSLFWTKYPHAPFLLFIPAILFSAWLAGRPGGLIATIVSMGLVKWLFMEPAETLLPHSMIQGFILLLFALIGYLLTKFQCQSGRRSLQSPDVQSPLETKQIASEYPQRTLIDHASDAIITMRVDGTIKSASPSFSKLIGYSREEALLLRNQQIFAPDSLALVNDYIGCFEADQQAGPEPDPFRADLQVRHRDGSIVWTDVSISPIRDTAGKAVELLAVLRDISERKQMEERLMISEARRRLMAEYATDVIWTMSLDGHFTYVSPSVEKLRGYTPEEVMLQSMTDTLCPESCAIAITKIEELKKNFLAGLPIEDARLELKQPRKDGSTVWTESAATVICDEKGVPVEILGVTRDITDRKSAEIQLARSTEALQQANTVKDKVFTILAHDLRSAIGSLHQGAMMLTSEKSLDDNTRTWLLKELESSSKTTLELLENLLNWSKSQTHSINLEIKPFNLNESIQEVVNLLRPAAKQKEITMDIQLDQPIVVSADRDSVDLILRNLLSNAIKFTRANGAVMVSAADSGDLASITVADNGMGMEKRVLDDLFRQNSYYSSVGTDREKGYGIGLVLCKDFVERNGGTIQAESTPEKGSRFTFTLPKAAH